MYGEGSISYVADYELEIQLYQKCPDEVYQKIIGKRTAKIKRQYAHCCACCTAGGAFYAGRDLQRTRKMQSKKAHCRQQNTAAGNHRGCNYYCFYKSFFHFDVRLIFLVVVLSNSVFLNLIFLICLYAASVLFIAKTSFLICCLTSSIFSSAFEYISATIMSFS